ncbi:Non-specific lipid-transfer protein isoform 1 [Hibiscus syriacus]|uniref:Non-specific lipid-transfer protein n=2 Tax=Hibiscus syriacus TaxID=106335 RepID=A0A6A3BI66_HIBSY|nr:Non-specific lipid-transfer protein isoform 1 [Hibiscus syriacus]
MAAAGVWKSVSLMLVVSMAVISGAPEMVKATITCSDVVGNLMPCLSYISNGGPISSACCSGVKTLYGEAQNPGDRQSVCKCIKSAVNGIGYSNINYDLVAGIPEKCGLDIPYKICPSTDCDK